MRRLALLFLFIFASSLATAVPVQIRVATFNASLNRTSQGKLVTDLSVTTNAQAKRVAEIIQRVRPDVLLINEFDYDASHQALDLFHNNYLAVSQNGQAALSYPYRYTASSNTGVPSGFDLDNDGTVHSTPGTNDTMRGLYGDDCFGFGWFPGQYGMAVYSRFPIRTAEVRTFQFFLWKDMPGAVWPDDPATPAAADWYSSAEKAALRLSSKSHWDLPIEIVPGQIVHLLASHPTPPAFDGTEDRNGHRNHDEIRFWADYIASAGYIYDDAGVHGGLASEQRFVVLGDMNADPLDGDSYLGAVNQLLTHPLINPAITPTSTGAAQAGQQGIANTSQHGDPAFDTGDFYDGYTGSGNLHIDHVLPSKSGFVPLSGGVFWPVSTDPTYSLVVPVANSSDHRMVWLDLALTPVLSQAVRSLKPEKQGADIVMTWGTQASVTYKIEQSFDLTTWAEATQIQVSYDPTAQMATAVDAGAAGQGKRYYRLITSLEATAAPAAARASARK